VIAAPRTVEHREQQLTDQQALELMLRLTCDCARDPHGGTD
jgi:hypothetical protein